MIWLWLHLALAQPSHGDGDGTPEHLVVERADQLWSQRGGRGVLTAARGTEQATKAVGIGPSAVFVDSQFGEPTQRQVSLGLEQPLDLGLPKEFLAKATYASAEARVSAARVDALMEAVEAWTAWWSSSQVTEHLTEHLAQMQADLQPFKDALNDGSLSPAAFSDLQSGVLAVQAELLRAHRATRLTEARAHQLLGDEALPPGASLESALPETNPWDTVPANTTGATLAARTADQAKAKQRVVGWSRAPVLHGGAMWAPDAQGQMTPFANLGATLPLQTGTTAERRRLRGQALAATAEAEWRLLQADQTLATQAAAWDALREEVVQLESLVVIPLEDRAKRLQNAATAGLVPLARWVDASRDHHEAEHEWLLLRAHLFESTSRASALRHLSEHP